MRMIAPMGPERKVAGAGMFVLQWFQIAVYSALFFCCCLIPFRSILHVTIFTFRCFLFGRLAIQLTSVKMECH